MRLKPRSIWLDCPISSPLATFSFWLTPRPRLEASQVPHLPRKQDRQRLPEMPVPQWSSPVLITEQNRQSAALQSFGPKHGCPRPQPRSWSHSRVARIFYSRQSGKQQGNGNLLKLVPWNHLWPNINSQHMKIYCGSHSVGKSGGKWKQSFV